MNFHDMAENEGKAGVTILRLAQPGWRAPQLKTGQMGLSGPSRSPGLDQREKARKREKQSKVRRESGGGGLTPGRTLGLVCFLGQVQGQEHWGAGRGDSGVQEMRKWSTVKKREKKTEQWNDEGHWGPSRRGMTKGRNRCVGSISKQVLGSRADIWSSEGGAHKLQDWAWHC